MLYDDDKRPGEDETGKSNENQNNDNYDKKPEDVNSGRDSRQSFSYGYGGYDNKPSGDKKPKDSYMSKKTVGWIVSLCLVVSIICGICASAVTGMIRGNKAETTTAPTDGTTSPVTQTTDVGGNVQITTSQTDTIVPASTVNAKDIPLATKTTGEKELANYAEVAGKCINSVVQINVTEVTQTMFGEQTSSGSGSGVIYTTDGYIITNYHVVGKDTKTITVILYDGSQYEGAYVCGDKSADVSVIKINKDDCQPAKIGDSSSLKLGEQVLAIGNPLGRGITLSDGIISALSRTVTVEKTTMVLMQTTAAINSGNSGGGLFNMKGELIGITNAKIGGTSVEAMGYAIPAEKVIKCINDFSKYGYLTGVARLGVTVNEYITIGRYSYNGVIRVVSVQNGGTAAIAGIKEGDIISSVAGTDCSDFSTLTELLTKYKVGDTVTVKILRPTEESASRATYQAYLRSCEEITLEVTFVEFDPS